MKNICSFLGVILLIVSCSQSDTLPDTTLNDGLAITNNHQLDKMAQFTEKFKQLHILNETRLARLNNNAFKKPGYVKKQGCVETAMVPDNYATIQEAVDAVCDYGNVIVKSGTYNEDAVVIYKPGLKIKAIGDVILNGGFGIEDYVDNITIQNFKIDMTNAFYEVAIGGFYNKGCNIKQNTVYGSSHIAIYFRYCNDMSIVQNNISGETDWGIFLDGYVDFGYCHNNTVANNTVTGITGKYYQPETCAGIEFRANCVDNTIMGNTVTSCGIGISLFSYGNDEDGYAFCNNNVLKNNIVKNSLNYGIRIWQGGAYNTIGPNNTSNNNGTVGILIHDIDANNNYTFNNTALYNGFYDIYNMGIDNTFKNNKTESTFGVD